MGTHIFSLQTLKEECDDVVYTMRVLWRSIYRAGLALPDEAAVLLTAIINRIKYNNYIYCAAC